MITLQFKDKEKRNEVFHSLRESTELNERQVTKTSNPVPVMLSESEFKLDPKGRVVYETAWYVSYPNEEVAWKRKKNSTKS